MAYQFKKELEKPERFVGGHRLCAGCGAGITCGNYQRHRLPGGFLLHVPLYLLDGELCAFRF